MPFDIFAKKKISVLFPTRGRPEMALKSMQSMINTADDPDGIEFLIAIDDDDQATIDYVQSDIVPYFEEHDYDFYAFVQPRLGYHRLNEYLNQLAGESHGEWLIVWNDDARMESQGWDTEILSHSGKFAVQRFDDNHGHPYAIFPVIPRDWIVMFECISPHVITDGWVSQVCYMNDAVIQLKSRCFHDRHDLTGNNNDSTYQERKPEQLEGDPSNPKDFLYLQTAKLRMQWGFKMEWLRRLLGQDTGYLERVRTGEIDIWTKMRENDPKGFLGTWKYTETESTK
tara:strand:+ start:46 stop:897 length:852 start_codon:yes stop_codon:yes gene_type:complete